MLVNTLATSESRATYGGLSKASLRVHIIKVRGREMIPAPARRAENAQAFMTRDASRLLSHATVKANRS